MYSFTVDILVTTGTGEVCGSNPVFSIPIKMLR